MKIKEASDCNSGAAEANSGALVTGEVSPMKINFCVFYCSIHGEGDILFNFSIGSPRWSENNNFRNHLMSELDRSIN